MKIERASSDDIASLHQLVESAYRGESSKVGWTTEADLLGGQRTDARELADIVGDPSQHMLVMRQGDALVGSILVADKSDGRAYFGMLTIDPKHQAVGLGRQLLAAGEDAARSFGATVMECQVIRQRDELIAWYARQGYVDTGDTRPFPMHDPRFGLPKRNDLEFIVMEKPL
ncbi:MAG: GNAT family N-acetyltransferase [Alphaproteobacteria bacterium]|nr:GNAT family N-acetyltransferase [Alphaproteobacteria bacterium]NNC48455.1 GNAT family N-acetyltransferase [Sphingomonas sp.]RZV49098.1 MAG: GNAT family N-acetyltransferase [Sphingomonadaceae bacterium]